MNIASTDPQGLAAHRFGSGPRLVMALHCTMAHSGAWRPLAAALEGEARFLGLDMFCHGRSPDWDGKGDFHDRMTEAALKHLTEPMDVVGHSFGATLAIRLAEERPEMVRSLTLIESVQFSVTRADTPEVLAERNVKARPFNEALDAGDTDLAAKLFNGDWSEGESGWEAVPEPRRAAMRRGVVIVPHCSPAIIDDRPGMLEPSALARVSMPVLLMRGSETEPIIGTVNDGLERRLADASNVVVPGAGHMLPITHPAETADALRTLFARAPI